MEFDDEIPDKGAVPMPETTPSAAQQMLGEITPKLADLTDQVLFGDVWERPGLSKRDRSLITISALVALYRTEQLPAHLRIGLGNGLTVEEIAEAITHLAFYSGWPTAFSAAAQLETALSGRTG
jgi:4-carboxymuconolactone decarboxylase